MTEMQVYLSGDPFKDLQICLHQAAVQATLVEEAINLMEAPRSHWRYISKAKDIIRDAITELRTLQTRHANMRDDLRRLGY